VGKNQILNYILKENFDCLLGFEEKKFVACCAVNRNTKEKNVLSGWLIYIEPSFRKKGCAKAITAELAKRAQREGFNSAKLGAGGKISRRILAGVKKNAKTLGVRGIRVQPKTGNITYPRKRRK